MGFFDFESAEREERSIQPVQGRGDTIHALLDHRWVSFAFITLIIAVVAQLPELMTLVAFIAVIVLVAWWWSQNSLRGLVYHRGLRYRRYFPDNEFQVEILVENRKLLPVSWFQVEDQWPMAVGLLREEDMPRTEDDPDVGYLINTYSLRWYERVRRRFDLVARQRGIYQLGPASLVSGDPFSLFDRKLTLTDRNEIIMVYPHIRTLPELGLPLKDPFGDHRVQRRLFEDPHRTMGVRDYTPQDSFRHIHWKASAHAGQLQTRVYEPTRSLRTVLCLNTATFEQHWRGIWPAMLEYEMDVAASLANWGLSNGHSVGMAANGTLARSDQPFRIAPSRNPNQLRRILETLAAVSYFVTGSFERFLIDESPRIPWGATLVIITPFVNDAITGTIMRLRDSGRRVVLIVLGKQPPPQIPRVLTYHLPIQEEEPPLPDPGEGEEGNADNDPFANLTPRQRYLLRRAQEEAEHAKPAVPTP